MKSCIQCQSKSVIKHWKRLGKQRYLCKSCNHVWELWKWRKLTKEDDIKLLHEYVINNAKYDQLWAQLWVSKQQIQKKIDNAGFEKNL
jgi:transposase-like protein